MSNPSELERTGPDPIYDNQDEDTINENEQRNKEAVEARRQLLMAFREVFNSDAGKKVLADIDDFAGKKLPSFNFNQGLDGMGIALKSAHQDGMKVIPLYIKEMTEAPLPEIQDKPQTAE